MTGLLHRRGAKLGAAVSLSAALCAAIPASVLAHDPGLSSLELVVTSSRVVAILSMATVDAAVILGPDAETNGGPTPEARGTLRKQLGSFALNTVAIRIDGRLLQGTVQDVEIDDEGGRVQLQFAGGLGSRVSVSSGVPRELARGHRELLSIRGGDGSVRAERLLDAQSGESVFDLGHVSSTARGPAGFLVMRLRNVLGGEYRLLFLAGLLFVVPPSRRMISNLAASTVARLRQLVVSKN